jgi:IS5 family transposase
MFKALLVQRFYNLSDEQTEYQINDRLSFQQFIGWTLVRRGGLADKIPDANTLWDFREALIGTGAFDKLFALFDEQLRARGLLAQPGKLVDASFVDVPRQRNSREQNATIKAGGTPAEWDDQPAKQRQKDVDARWTKKNDEKHYGYKNHIKADAKSKLIEQYAVTDASVHDSQMLEPLVDGTEGEVYADSAYRSAEAETMLVGKEVTSQIHERAYRNRPLTDTQKETNRQKSKVRHGSNMCSAT